MATATLLHPCCPSITHGCSTKPATCQPCLLPQHSALAAPCDTTVPLWSCTTVPFPGRAPGRQLYLAPSHVAGSHLPVSECPPWGYATASWVQAHLCLQQPLTYTASILVLGESLPALHLGRSRDRQDGEESALGSH